MKKFLIVSLFLLLLGYLIFSVIYFGDSARSRICQNFKIEVKDSLHTRFIDSKTIKKQLNSKRLDPEGKRIKTINTLDIEEAICTNELVKSAHVFIAQNGDVIAEIYQRNPVLRVISHTQASYYIDSHRERMPVSSNFSVYVPVATGNISEEFAKGPLYDFAVFLAENPQWDAWVEQIVVNQSEHVEIVPRVGDFKVIIGSIDDIADKLAKLTVFIDKGLNVVGWNRYSVINLKFDNQVVCTKK